MKLRASFPQSSALLQPKLEHPKVREGRRRWDRLAAYSMEKDCRNNYSANSASDAVFAYVRLFLAPVEFPVGGLNAS